MTSESPSSATQALLSRILSLVSAPPLDRGRSVLRLIEEHAEGRLELPASDGVRATLDGIDLGRDRLEAERAEGAAPRWWSAERRSLNLARADLLGASMRGTILRGAILEGANLAEADLAGADLAGADLSGAFLRGTLLEGADLRTAVLRFVRGEGAVLEDARLQGADLWGAKLDGADLSGADLSGATLEEATLARADLTRVDFRRSVLKRADLGGADLRGADLRGATLGGTNLAGAVLRDAKLEDLDLTDCTLTHAHLCGARLEKTRLEREQLGGAIGEEGAGEYGLAGKGYLALERNFNELGDHDAARWAYGRRRRMEKLEALRQSRAAWAGGRKGAAFDSAVKYVGDQAVEWVCDYGESVGRVLATLLTVYVFFILVYAVSGSVARAEDAGAGRLLATTRDPTDLALFSLTAMTATGSYPSGLVPRNAFAHALSGLQTLVTIFLTGLMGFVAGNRIRR